MAPAGCRTIDVQVDINYYNMIISYIQYITLVLWPDHITCIPGKNKLDVLYFFVACFTWLLWVSSMIASYLRKTTTEMCKLLFNLSPRTASVKTNSTKVDETDTRQSYLCNELHVGRRNQSLVYE